MTITIRSEIQSLGEMQGRLSLPAGELEVSAPPEFGGEEEGNTPEDLQAGALNSCFLMTLQFFVNQMDLDVENISCTVETTLEKGKSGWEFEKFTISPRLTASEPRNRLESVLEKSKETCFVSKLISVPVTLDLSEVDTSG
ncbi:MAG: OsmC family protein [bacterium]